MGGGCREAQVRDDGALIVSPESPAGDLDNRRRRPLEGIRVLDVSTIIAAPFAAMLLGDYGAEVIKVEHPKGGDPARTHGEQKDGVPLWWLMLGRNKKSVTLYLGVPEGQEVFKTLAKTADVIIENFRPGTMEAWGLGYDELRQDNPGLVMAHLSGFGRTGPMANEPGFGTMAEVMSGFAFRNGFANQPPTLPPFGLGDGVTGFALAFAVTVALQERHCSHLGQEIDLAIIEPLLSILEPQLTTLDQLGQTLQRTGNQTEMNAPRGLYQSQSGEWIALSASTVSTAAPLMRLLGREDLVDESWFNSARGRRAHANEIDALISTWMGALDTGAVLAQCREAGVPVFPVYSAREILDDPQYREIGTIGEFEHEQLGKVRMPNVLSRFSVTPGAVQWLGPELGRHTNDVLQSLGLSPSDVDALRAKGVV